MDAFVPLLKDGEVPGLALQGLAAIGGLFLAAKIFSFVYLLLELFILPGTSFSKFGPKGSWAVVTGASDGLGAEYARQLARKGFNLVLVSRTAAKLEALSKELKAAHAGLQTKLLPMDFARSHDADFATLATLVAGLDVAILINNVGVSHAMPVPFLDTPRPELDAIVAVNVVGTLRVTQLVAPQMVARRRGLILTMASFGGLTPTPLLATYSGSKAFLQQWSTALGAELAPAGVSVQLVQSYLVTSAMSKIRRTSLLIPNPKQFVRSALASIGLQRGAQGIAYSCTPYWTHALMHWALTTFTGTMNSLVVGQNKSMHEAIRKRALRKAEREAKKA